MKYHLLLVVSLSATALFSQPFHNQKWLIEDYIQFDFTGGGDPVITLETPPEDMGPGDHTNSICDKDGNLLFYTGGCFIGNREHKVMLNGDTINSEYAYDLGLCYYGDFHLTNNNILLPYPGDEGRYIIFNLDVGPKIAASVAPLPHHLLYHIVDMSLDGGNGGLIANGGVAINDYLASGSVAAVKHTNDRDWWVVVPQFKSNCYYVVPVTPDGVGTPSLQCLGYSYSNLSSGGQASFSPDGTKYARVEPDNGLMLMQFDASQGILSDALELEYTTFYTFSHAANFSGNSRYLYIAADDRIYQYDTDAADIQSTITWVGGMSVDTLSQGQNGFGTMMLGPNGKMYISCVGLGRWFSSIERPNCPGLACKARVHKIYLPHNNFSGNNSQPHFFAPPQDFNCDASTTTEVPEAYRLSVWPNPALDRIHTNVPQNGLLQIQTLEGKVLQTQLVEAGPCSMAINVPAGMYLMSYRSASGSTVVEKVVVRE